MLKENQGKDAAMAKVQEGSPRGQAVKSAVSQSLDHLTAVSGVG